MVHWTRESTFRSVRLTVAVGFTGVINTQTDRLVAINCIHTPSACSVR